MTDNHAGNIEDLLAVLKTHPRADFYRLKWGTAERFSSLPTISRSDFVRTPLSSRRYKHEKELIKIVHALEGTFATAWSFSDSARERFGKVLKRPMVYFENPHEAIEKSLWCYEQGTVPLIGEGNPTVALYGAEVYQIDSILADLPSLQKLQPYLEKRTKPLGIISVHLSFFLYKEFLPFVKYAKEIRLILTLPEAGVFAQAKFAEKPVFIPCEDVVIEHESELILTKLAYLTTPIIRYRTGVRSQLIKGKKDGSFVIVPA